MTILFFLTVVPPALAFWAHMIKVFDIPDMIHFLLAYCILCAMLLIHEDAEENKRKSKRILHNQLEKYRSPKHNEELHSMPNKEIEVRDILKVKASHPISDSYVVLGAVRAPYTSFVLSAGNKDVHVERIYVGQFKTAQHPNFKSISLVDVRGIPFARAEGLGGHINDLESFEVRLKIPKNESRVFAVVGDITDDVSMFKSGVSAGFTIAGVVADTEIQGEFPISGATHNFGDALNLQRVKIAFKKDKLSLKISSDKNCDKEGAYVRNIGLELESGVSDHENIQVMVRGAEYPLEIHANTCFVIFPQNGLYMKAGEKIKMSLVSAKNRDIKIKAIHDVYVVGAEYGYGLPVDVKEKFFL